MIRLGLKDPTEEQLLAALTDALKARRLLENDDFKWWTEKLEMGEEKHKNNLIYDSEPAEFYRHQGAIRTIRLSLKELRFRAEQVEALEERLKQYDRAKEPVARGA